MNRLRLYDFRVSRGPTDLGICQGDIPACAAAVNTAQRRLLFCREAGEDGWWGSWAEMAFTVDQNNPYITTPRHVARLTMIDVCNYPIQIQNQFYEYLQFGNGRMPPSVSRCGCNLQAYSRNNVPTYTDPTTAPVRFRVYSTNSADHGVARVLFQGVDSNNLTVRTMAGTSQVQGEYVTVDAPFSQTVYQYNSLSGIQKDRTFGDIQIFQVDGSGTETLIHTMEPTETTGWYRRYYFHRLPNNCCGEAGSISPVSITAMAKLELIPCVADSDYLLIQNLEAIIEEAQSARYSVVDESAAKQMAAERHTQAVRLLQGELVHYLGKEKPAMSFAPFGSAHLNRQAIGRLI